MRTIEVAQRQAAVARNQVKQLEQNHLEQAARISQVRRGCRLKTQAVDSGADQDLERA